MIWIGWIWSTFQKILINFIYFLIFLILIKFIKINLFYILKKKLANFINLFYMTVFDKYMNIW